MSALHAPRRALIYGFYAWLIPFVTSFFLFPLRQSLRPLFESLMCVVLASTVTWMAYLYFRDTQRDSRKEGVAVGVLWMAISLAIDLPLFLQGPMKMSLANYVMDIGVTYLAIPAITFGFGCLVEKRQPEKPAA